MIDSVDALKNKLSMVENLLQISSTQRLSAQIGGAPEGEHPTDGLYRRLKCSLAPASDGEAAMVREYQKKWAAYSGPTHEMPESPTKFAKRGAGFGAPSPAKMDRLALF